MAVDIVQKKEEMWLGREGGRERGERERFLQNIKNILKGYTVEDILSPEINY